MKIELSGEELSTVLDSVRSEREGLQETIGSLEETLSEERIRIAELQAEVKFLKSAPAVAAATADSQGELKAANERDHILRAISTVNSLVFSNQKIAAIKLVRELTRCGLKEAKDAVEGSGPHLKLSAY